VSVRIINDEYSSFPIRPTAFTPNEDGRNDLWYCESRNDLFLQVFDRWGRLVHEESGKRVTWNGGSYMPGSYPYVLTMETCSGKKRNTRGIIELIR
jgi:gliding motility-associated-like protein